PVPSASRVAEGREQRARGTGAVRVLRLPLVAQLRHRQLLACGDEDRVVAEAFASRRLGRDPSLERARTAELAPIGGEEDELGDVPRSPVLHALELAQQLRDRRRPLGRVAGGEHTRATAERLDLEPGVLVQHPAARLLASEIGLEECVLVVRRARLGRIAVAVERLERPTGKEPFELARLVPVPRAENRCQSVHCTSSTPSTAATPATTATGVMPD